MHAKPKHFHMATSLATAMSKGNIITASLAILGLYFGFPNAIIHLPILALGYPLALYHVGLSTPTCAHTSKKSTLAVFRTAWLMSIVAVSICLYWVSIPVHNVGGLPWFLAVPCALAISAYIALFGALFATIVHATKDIFPRTTRGLMARGILAGLVWCLLEYARNVVLTGFPWLSLSAAFVPWPVVTQGASMVGTYGLSGLIVISTVLYYEAFMHRKDAPIRIATGRLAANIITVLLAFGIYQLYFTEQNDDSATLHGAFIQGNIDQNQKWSKSYQDATVHRYLSLSLEAVKPFPAPSSAQDTLHPFTKPSFLIWPETSMPFFLQDEEQYMEQFQAFANEHDVALLMGTLAYVHHPKSQAMQEAKAGLQPYDVYNRAYLVMPEQDSMAGQNSMSTPRFLSTLHNPTATLPFYDKEHLVPFGEYVPWWLKISFLEDLMQGIGAFTEGGRGAAYSNGDSQDSSVQDPKSLMWQDLALGMLICYESIFPELAQDRVTDGATILINISNDAWFGDTSAPEQHLHLSAMRAIEQGRYLVRGTNTGISAVVDDLGRIVVQGPLFSATSISFTAKERTTFTVYHQIAPYLPWLVFALTVFIFAIYAIPKRHRNS